MCSRFYCRRQASYLQNTVIVGAGDVGQLIARKLLHHPEYGINVVGFVDAEPKERGPGLADLTLLGGPRDLLAVIRRFDVDRVIIAFSREQHTDTLDLIRELRDIDVQVDVVPAPLRAGPARPQSASGRGCAAAQPSALPAL